MTAERPAFATYLARMQALGFRPRRQLGQNFLLDPSLHRAIAALAAVGPEDLALEIGAGLGFLTRELAATGAHVLAVEIDPRLCAIVRQELLELGEASARVQLVEADVLGPDEELAPEVCAALAAWAPGANGRLVVVANLPYAISGPLLARLPLLARPPERIVVLVQRELAERLSAAPGSPAYGSLSAALAAGYAARMDRVVGREVFRPRPNVDSALLVLERAPERPLWAMAPELRRRFLAFVRAAFGQRRKTLRAVLARRGAAWSAALASEIGGRRAEELPVETLAALFLRLEARPT